MTTKSKPASKRENLLLTVSGTGTTFAVKQKQSEGIFWLCDIDTVIPYKLFDKNWWDDKSFTAQLNEFIVHEAGRAATSTPWLLFIGALPFTAITQKSVLGWVNVGVDVISQHRSAKFTDSGQPTSPVDPALLAARSERATEVGKPEFKSIEAGIAVWLENRSSEPTLMPLDSISRKQVSNKLRKLRRIVAKRARKKWGPKWAGWRVDEDHDQKSTSVSDVELPAFVLDRLRGDRSILEREELVKNGAVFFTDGSHYDDFSIAELSYLRPFTSVRRFTREFEQLLVRNFDGTTIVDNKGTKWAVTKNDDSAINDIAQALLQAEKGMPDLVSSSDSDSEGSPEGIGKRPESGAPPSQDILN